MTRNAIPRIARNLLVLCIHIRLAVAACTRPGTRSRGVTVGTLPIGTTMRGREGMIKSSSRPGRSVMAHRALPIIMVGRPSMTSLTVSGASNGVVEAGWLPGIGVMASRALPTVVTRRFVLGMARDAIGGSRSGMVEMSRQPAAGAVTRATLAVIMPRRLIFRMTGNTIGSSCDFMIETSRKPGLGGVTCRAYARIVVSGFIAGMTEQAVRSHGQCVVKRSRYPGGCVMTGSTLERVMVRRCCVAALASGICPRIGTCRMTCFTVQGNMGTGEGVEIVQLAWTAHLEPNHAV